MMRKDLKWYSFRWRAFLVVFLLIGIVGGYIGCRFYDVLRIRPMGSGPAGPLITAEPFESQWLDKEVVYLGVGDSITRGFGAAEGLRCFDLILQNEDQQHPDMAGKDLRHVARIHSSQNFAQDYTVSRQHIDQQLVRIPVFDKACHGIVIVTSGGNDLIHDYGRTPPRHDAMYGSTIEQARPWCELLQNRIDTLLTGLMERFPGGCDIFLANIYDPTDGVGDPQKAGLPRWSDCVEVLSLANEKIAELCEKYPNVHRVDIHTPFLGHGIHFDQPWRKHYHKEDPYFWYDPILEDPNPRGHDAIRRVFLLKMAEVFNPPERTEQIEPQAETES